jgi:hypothetical protein
MNNIIKYIIASILIIGIIIILIVTGQITFIFQLFGWIQHFVRNVTGADILIVNAITAILLAILCVIPIGTLLRVILPFPQKNKKIYRATVFICLAAFFLAIFFISKNVFFSPDTGAPLKYYSIMPNGEYKFYSSGVLMPSLVIL